MSTQTTTNKKTSIRVDDTTADDLFELEWARGASYNDVIDRLIYFYNQYGDAVGDDGDMLGGRDPEEVRAALAEYDGD